jgi:hypothetical protein
MNHSLDAAAARDLDTLISELEAEFTEIREFAPLSDPSHQAHRSQALATTFFFGCCVTD